LMKNVATATLAKLTQRIHQEGLAADGTDIGAYSTKPSYVSSKTGYAVEPIGKTGKSQFARGKKKGQAHTSQYFAGGYGQFKTAIGKSDGKVNLVLTGGLSEQLTVLGEPSATGYGLGWINEEYLKRAQDLEQKYGKQIWALSEEERRSVAEVAQMELVRVLT
jgi:hypothetical protein